MREFNTLNALQEYIQKAIEQSLLEKPVSEIKKTMQTQILREVYLAYKPKVYMRRGNDGGLIDEENIIAETRDKKTVEIMNVTKRDGEYAQLYLTPLIEYGHTKYERLYNNVGYRYPNPKASYFYARPFIQATRNELKQNKQHIHALTESLKKYGIKADLR